MNAPVSGSGSASASAPRDRHDYFDAMYRADDDPYGMRDRWYETRKRAVLMASLPRPRYRSAIEPGCGAGELTAELAPRCDRLLSTDFTARAVEITRERVRSQGHVSVRQQRLPQDWPREESFDLIVLSEMGYFLEADAMARLAALCGRSLAPGGTLVACHWLPDFAERALPTAEVHALLAGLGLPLLLSHREDDFLLEIWSRDERSVAQAEGIR